MEFQHIGDKPKYNYHECLIAIDERGDGLLINSEPSLYEYDIFDGNSLQDNINKYTDRIPKELGIYKCKIVIHSYSYYTDCGTEYDTDSWIEDVVKLDLVK
jgi:hypothetical protein